MIESDMVKGIIQYKCDLCGNTFVYGNDADGIPNGIQFNFSDGSVYTFCKSCIASRYQDAIKMVDAKEQGQEDDSEFFLHGYGGTMSTQNS